MKDLKPYVAPPARKADTAIARGEFEKKMAAFKSAHGFRERYSIVFHCSRFEKSFVTVYERGSDKDPFKIASNVFCSTRVNAPAIDLVSASFEIDAVLKGSLSLPRSWTVTNDFSKRLQWKTILERALKP